MPIDLSPVSGYSAWLRSVGLETDKALAASEERQLNDHCSEPTISAARDAILYVCGEDNCCMETLCLVAPE